MPATTIQAVETQVFANRCGDNLLNKNLTFDSVFSANVVSGSGTASTSTDVIYSGQRSLYVNNVGASPLVISGGGTNWYNDFTGSYILGANAVQQFSIFNSMGSGTTITGRLNVYFDSFLVYILEFSATAPIGLAWQTFYATLPFNSNYDYTFELDDIVDGSECYLDGIKLEIDDKQSNNPSPYTGYFEKEFFVSTAIDVPNILTLATTTVTATLTGAIVGDFVQMTYPVALITSGLVVGVPIVTANDTISFIIYNPTGLAVNPASGTYTFKIKR